MKLAKNQVTPQERSKSTNMPNNNSLKSANAVMAKSVTPSADKVPKIQITNSQGKSTPVSKEKRSSNALPKLSPRKEQGSPTPVTPSNVSTATNSPASPKPPPAPAPPPPAAAPPPPPAQPPAPAKPADVLSKMMAGTITPGVGNINFCDKIYQSCFGEGCIHRVCCADGEFSSDGCCSRLGHETKKGIMNTLTFVLDPAANGYYRWLSIISVAAFYNLVFVVVRSVWNELQIKNFQIWLTLDYICDFIYLVDMFIQTRTGYLEQGLMVTDLKKLAKRYFVSKVFLRDIFSLLPFDVLYFVVGFEQAEVRFNRVLRAPRLSEFFDKTETRTNYPNLFRIVQLVLTILTIMHWNACLFYAVSLFIGLGRTTWVYPHNVTVAATQPFLTKYIYSFWWSTMILTTIGEVPSPELDEEYVFQVADLLIGVLIFATIVGNVGSMISNMNATKSEFQHRMDAVKQYMEFRKVPHVVQSRVIQWFGYMWSKGQALDEQTVLASLPDKLRGEIAIHVHLETLKRVRLFQEVESGLLTELVLKLKLQVFSPGDYICRKGDIGKEMYIVKTGKLEVVGEDLVTVFVTLSDGSVFGEISLLSIPGNKTGNRRTANVRSKGYSDLFVLSKEDLYNALEEYPDAKDKLTSTGQQILMKEGKIDEELAKKQMATQANIGERVLDLEGSLELMQTRLARLLGDFTSSEQLLKQRIAILEANPPSTSKSRTRSVSRRPSHSTSTPPPDITPIHHPNRKPSTKSTKEKPP